MSPRNSGLSTDSCSSWARAENPRRKRARSMPITSAATEQARMIPIVTPPCLTSSRSSVPFMERCIARRRGLRPSAARGRCVLCYGSAPFELFPRRQRLDHLDRTRARLRPRRAGSARHPRPGLAGRRGARERPGRVRHLLEDARAVAFHQLPGFPSATVQGHKGRLVFGSARGIPILALQGRLHGYEGHDAATVAFPARVLGVLGARARWW